MSSLGITCNCYELFNISNIKVVEIGNMELNDLKYYVEPPRCSIILKEIRPIDHVIEIIVNLKGPIKKLNSKRQILKVLCFANLLSLPHLLTRKTQGTKLLVDYNILPIVTSNVSLDIMRQKTLDKEVVEQIYYYKSMVFLLPTL